MPGRALDISLDAFPIQGSFKISREERTEATCLCVTVSEGDHRGRGECTPYARYGESVESVNEQIEAVRREVEDGADRMALTGLLPRGAARNAIDCALWDLEAKQTNKPVWRLAGLEPPRALCTAFTLSVGRPDEIAKQAADADWPLIKLKLGGDDADIDRIVAATEAAPRAAFILDANEALSFEGLIEIAEECGPRNVVLIEQPLPAGADGKLMTYDGDIPLCADESVHGPNDVDGIAARYTAINVKLGKTGGLTEALDLIRAAREHELRVMVGCAVSSSLSMAPAFYAAQLADFVDLDGPLLLAADRPHPIEYNAALMSPPDPRLWG